MFDNKSYIKIKTSSERNFAIVYAIFFAIVGIYPLWFDEKIHTWAFIISPIILIMGLYAPNLLILPNKLWNRLGFFLGAIVSPIIMALLYYLTFTPTGIIMRFRGKDLLNEKIDKTADSYWIKRNTPPTTMKYQF